MEKWGTKMKLENSEHKKICFGETGELSIYFRGTRDRSASEGLCVNLECLQILINV